MSSDLHYWLGEGQIERRGGCRAETWKDVRVRVQGDPDARVAQALRDDLWMDARAKQQARMGMSEVVPADVAPLIAAALERIRHVHDLE